MSIWSSLSYQINKKAVYFFKINVYNLALYVCLCFIWGSFLVFGIHFQTSIWSLFSLIALVDDLGGLSLIPSVSEQLDSSEASCNQLNQRCSYEVIKKIISK